MDEQLRIGLETGGRKVQVARWYAVLIRVVTSKKLCDFVLYVLGKIFERYEISKVLSLAFKRGQSNAI